MEETTNQLGQFVRQQRARLGLGLRDLAVKARLPHPTVLRIENGATTQPKPYVLESLARALDVDYESLATLAGYVRPGQLPETQVFLRAKEGLTEEEAAAIKSHVDFIKATRREEGERHAS